MEIFPHLFEIQVLSDTLSIALWSKNKNDRPRIIALHGAGNSTKDRFHSIANHLLKKNLSSLAFDFSGHGKSSGQLKKSNLFKRVVEAQSVIEKFGSNFPLTLFGMSMGGYTAIKLLAHLNVQTLVLICPAIYSRSAYAVPFEEGFSQIIRRPGSFLDSDALDLLSQFRGKLLVIVGEKDEVIPIQVIDLIVSNATLASEVKLLKIPESPHLILSWLELRPDLKSEIFSTITHFVESSFSQ